MTMLQRNQTYLSGGEDEDVFGEDDIVEDGEFEDKWASVMARPTPSPTMMATKTDKTMQKGIRNLLSTSDLDKEETML